MRAVFMGIILELKGVNQGVKEKLLCVIPQTLHVDVLASTMSSYKLESWARKEELACIMGQERGGCSVV